MGYITGTWNFIWVFSTFSGIRVRPSWFTTGLFFRLLTKALKTIFWHALIEYVWKVEDPIVVTEKPVQHKQERGREGRGGMRRGREENRGRVCVDQDVFQCPVIPSKHWISAHCAGSWSSGFISFDYAGYIQIHFWHLNHLGENHQLQLSIHTDIFKYHLSGKSKNKPSSWQNSRGWRRFLNLAWGWWFLPRMQESQYRHLQGEVSCTETGFTRHTGIMGALEDLYYFGNFSVILHFKIKSKGLLWWSSG